MTAFVTLTSHDRSLASSSTSAAEKNFDAIERGIAQRFEQARRDENRDIMHLTFNTQAAVPP